MPTVKGGDQVRSFLTQLPAELEDKVLRGAARAAARVVADEAKARCVSTDVSAAIKVRSRLETARAVGLVQVDMGGYNLPLWLEYGTEGHFISVSDVDRHGMSVRKVNEATKAGSLVIGGKFVGETVWHPGASPRPFLRPALDTQESEAIAAAQAYINRHVTPGGIVGGEDAGDDE